MSNDERYLQEARELQALQQQAYEEYQPMGDEDFIAGSQHFIADATAAWLRNRDQERDKLSIPREEVKRVLEERRDANIASAMNQTANVNANTIDWASAIEDELIASALNLTLTAHSTSDTRKEGE